MTPDPEVPTPPPAEEDAEKVNLGDPGPEQPEPKTPQDPSEDDRLPHLNDPDTRGV